MVVSYSENRPSEASGARAKSLGAAVIHRDVEQTQKWLLRIAAADAEPSLPAVGLGVVAAGVRRVTDAMVLAAARALAEKSPALQDVTAPLLPALPALADLREVAMDIATAVGQQAQNDGVAQNISEHELRQRVTAVRWSPEYPTF